MEQFSGLDVAVVLETALLLGAKNVFMRWWAGAATAGQGVAMMFQLRFTFRLLMVMLALGDRDSKTARDAAHNDAHNLSNQFLGYFLYDTVFLVWLCIYDLLKQVARLQLKPAPSVMPYVIHHVLSAVLILIGFYSRTDPWWMMMSYFIVEAGNPSLNAMKILKWYVPGTRAARFMIRMTKITYFVTRMIMLPIFIIAYTSYSMQAESGLGGCNLVLIAGYTVIFECSRRWYLQLLSK